MNNVNLAIANATKERMTGMQHKRYNLQTQVKFKETLQSHRHRSVDVVGHLKREK